MPTIIISGPAQAFADNPHATKAITDRKTLARFHGLASEVACADLFDKPPLNKLRISGGRLRFVFDYESNALRIVTAYRVAAPLSNEQTNLLVEATRAQWSDGCGSGSFENFHGTVHSVTFAVATLNAGKSRDDIGDYFVDAFPLFASDEAPRVEVSKRDDGEKDDIDYLREAAAIGEPEAQYQLARRLEIGADIEQNQPLAVEYYQKASDQGHMLACTFLGICLQWGIGTTPDLKRGFGCFAKAAQEDLPLAIHCLGECYLEGRGIKQNNNEGIRWYTRGSKLGDLGCTAQLAECYELGKAVAQDLRKALELYKACMAGGHDEVKPAFERVKKRLKDAEDI